MSALDDPHAYSGKDRSFPDEDEKYGTAKHVDEAVPYSQESLDSDPVYSIQEQRKIIHRVDRRLIATCGIMYCISLMDRTNLSAAAIAGMTVELKMNVGFRYVRSLTSATGSN